MILQRRKFLMGLGALMAAPAIVSISNIMPVKATPSAAFIPWDYIRVMQDGYTTFLHPTPVDLERLAWMKNRVGFGEVVVQEMRWNPHVHEVGGISEDIRAAFREHGL